MGPFIAVSSVGTITSALGCCASSASTTGVCAEALQLGVLDAPHATEPTAILASAPLTATRRHLRRSPRRPASSSLLSKFEVIALLLVPKLIANACGPDRRQRRRSGLRLRQLAARRSRHEPVSGRSRGWK